MSLQLAIPFALNNDENNLKASEFNIIFKKDRNSLEKLLEFAEAYPDYRINIEMDIIDVQMLNLVNRAHDKIYVRLTDVSHFEQVPALKEKNIKFFMDYKLFPVKSKSELAYLIALGVTDIYPADDLLYEVKELHEILVGHNIKARMVLNKVPYTLPNVDDPRIPWFTPQNVDILDQFIDTVEFDFQNDPKGWKQFEVYYKTWFIKKHWHGNLREIIQELNFNIANDSLFSEELLHFKINCGRRCVNADSHCKRCEQYIEIANALDSMNIGIVQD